MPKAKGDRKDLVNYVNNIQIPVNAQMLPRPIFLAMSTPSMM